MSQQRWVKGAAVLGVGTLALGVGLVLTADPDDTAQPTSSDQEITPEATAAEWTDEPIGFAALPGEGLDGTTGGAAGETVTVTTQEELAEYAEAEEPYTILVEGTIEMDPFGETIDVTSDKSIIGVDEDAEIFDPEVITPRETALQEDAGIALLRGNLAPDGAIIKPAAASRHLLSHRGRALVFDSIEDFRERIDDPDLDVDADSVLVLRGCGPKGYPGMPEVSNMPLPAKLLEQGVRDMVRICDGRMSGTAYGTVVLHVAPEAAAGGPLGLVQTGDWVELDVAARRLDVDVPAEELAARTPSAAMTEAFAAPTRGWEKLYVEHVQQADTGADLDFLIGSSGSEVLRESH